MEAQEESYLVKPNFDDLVEQVGPGEYKVRIKSSKVGQWPGRDGRSPTTYIAWTMETFGEDLAENNGRYVFHNTPIEGKGIFRLKNFFKAALGEELTGEFDRTSLYGRELQIVIAPQKNAPQYNEVQSVSSL